MSLSPTCPILELIFLLATPNVPSRAVHSYGLVHSLVHLIFPSIFFSHRYSCFYYCKMRSSVSTPELYQIRPRVLDVLSNTNASAFRDKENIRKRRACGGERERDRRKERRSTRITEGSRWAEMGRAQQLPNGNRSEKKGCGTSRRDFWTVYKQMHYRYFFRTMPVSGKALTGQK